MTLCLGGSRSFQVNSPRSSPIIPGPGGVFTVNLTDVTVCGAIYLRMNTFFGGCGQCYLSLSHAHARARRHTCTHERAQASTATRPTRPTRPTPPNDSPVVGATNLGFLSWACDWVQPMPPTSLANLQLATCTGLITLDSSWHKMTADSTAAYSFWANTTQILTGTVSEPITPIVTATKGAWPKPETVTDLTWGIVSRATFWFKIFLRLGAVSGHLILFHSFVCLHRSNESSSFRSITSRGPGTRCLLSKGSDAACYVSLLVIQNHLSASVCFYVSF